jgi:hypothetical protein
MLKAHIGEKIEDEMFTLPVDSWNIPKKIAGYKVKRKGNIAIYTKETVYHCTYCGKKMIHPFKSMINLNGKHFYYCSEKCQGFDEIKGD